MQKGPSGSDGSLAKPSWTFTEKNFYLAEFRGRSLVLALPPGEHPSLEPLGVVLEDLAANGTRVVLVSQDRALLEKAMPGELTLQDSAGWLGALWRELQERPHASLLLSPGGLEQRCSEAVGRIRPAKLVWLDAAGGLQRPGGGRVSVFDLADLGALLEAGGAPVDDNAALLEAIQAMLRAGLPSVNWCRLEDLADDLFTYAGSGTFFTRDRYAEVRPLALDDFDAAADLIARGVDEGYLVRRDDVATQRVLDHGFGIFIEGRYLAGIVSLLPHAQGGAAEIASLYTLTRFVGEGVGGQLVRHAIQHASGRGHGYVFACTSSERVEAFFERNGFRKVGPDAIPPEKWEGYPPERRERVRCLRVDLPATN
jgi:N-acetylglutamate synthase-like GNAT family acetyltransferase